MPNESKNNNNKHRSIWFSLPFQLVMGFVTIYTSFTLLNILLINNRLDYTGDEIITTTAHDIAQLTLDRIHSSDIPINKENSSRLQTEIASLANINEASYAAIYDLDLQMLALWEHPQNSYYNPSLRINSNRNIFNYDDVIHVITPILQPDGQQLGYMVLGLDKTKQNAAIDHHKKILAAIFLGIAAFCILIINLTLHRIIVMPLRAFINHINKILSSGDLSSNIDIGYTNNDLINLASSFSMLIGNMRTILKAVKELSLQLSMVVDDVSLAGNEVNNSVNHAQGQTNKTTYIMKNILNSVNDLTKNVSDIDQNGEQAASAIYEMTKVNDQVVKNINNMNAAITAVKAAVKQSTMGINNISDNIDILNNDIATTTTAIETMTATVDAIETTTRETAQLSEEVTQNAAAGMDAIKKTTAGIEVIKHSSEMAAETIGHLGKRINDIGSIIHVIEDITKQTNLLALNAAIIAAQSGENGKSFGVVSEEIAALANRTKSSTREIAELIASIQEESNMAIEAMQEDMGSIEEGVRLSQAAEEILSVIEASANRSTSTVQKIAATSLDQAEDIREFNAAMTNISKSIKEIHVITSKQATEANTIQTNINNISNLSQQVLNSANEQASGTKDLLHAVNAISHSLSALNEAQKYQEHEMSQSMNRLDNIMDTVNNQTKSTNKLDNTINTIKAQVIVLNEQVSQYKI